MNPMNLKNRNRPVVDILFLLALFSVFLISALFVVLFGAKIYRNTVAGMDENFKTRTALSYITEKIHQHDRNNCISIIDYEGSTVLRLLDETDGNIYYTYLYEDEGYLMELTAKSDFDFNKSGGQKILETDGFSIEAVSDSLYKIILTDNSNKKLEYFVSSHCSSLNAQATEKEADDNE